MRAQAKKWVVTGGAGFIGSHIIKELVSRGQEVVAVDDFSTGSLSNLSSVQQKIKIVSADICNFSALLKAFQGADYVLHHAALVSVPRSVEEPQLTWQINVSGTLNVLEAARQAGVKRVVFASSCCVYGTSSKPCKETSPKRPGSPYALSKQIGEELCRFYTQMYGLETVCLCYFNVYGVGQNPNGAYAAVIAQFLQRARNGEPVRIDGTGRQSRDFIAVEDVARANILVAKKGVPGETYNVACGKSYSLLALLRLIEQTTHQKLTRTFAPSRAGDVRTSSADISKISRLGFTPRVTLKTGIARLWHSLKK